MTNIRALPLSFYSLSSSVLFLLSLLVAGLDGADVDTHTLAERDFGLGALSDDEHVSETGGEFVVVLVLDVDNVERTGVSLLVSDDTNTTNVVSASDEDNVADFKLDVTDRLVGLQVDLDRVVDLDVGVNIANSATIVSGGVRDGSSLSAGRRVGANRVLVSLADRLDAAELELGLVFLDFVQSEATLGVIENAVELLGGGDGDDVHEASGEVHVSANLAIDLDVAAHDDHQAFAAGQSILQAVTQDQREGKAFTDLVGTGRRARGPGAAELVEHP